MYIKPKEGKQVPDPQTGQDLISKGKNVDDLDIYWLRRHADGDVDILEEAPPDDLVEEPATALVEKPKNKQ